MFIYNFLSNEKHVDTSVMFRKTVSTGSLACPETTLRTTFGTKRMFSYVSFTWGFVGHGYCSRDIVAAVVSPETSTSAVACWTVAARVA